MNNLTSKKTCTGCGVCAQICPQRAITLKPDKEGFLYPSVNESLCTHCNLCIQKCPCHKTTTTDHKNLYFGAHAKEPSLRLLGSSGGIFPLLARHVLQQGGVVYGACLMEDGSIAHKGIDKVEDLEQITRTKYVQSDLSNIWEPIRSFLHEGRIVLFCGTPCQTEGLRFYLGTAYSNLLLVDLVCYGVPSPGIWQRYITFLHKKYDSRPHMFYFRDKCNQDNGHTVRIQCTDKEYTYSVYKDLVLRSFFKSINLRPSCYHCSYCTVSRNSDITLGDFWGIERTNPSLDDGMGNSIMICHTPKGLSLFNNIKNQLIWFQYEEHEITQPRLQKPTKCPPTRWIYMLLYRILPFSLWIRLFKV